MLASTVGLLASPAVVRAQGQKERQNAGVALVIGNSKYRWEASLPNVQRDVRDIAKRFQALGLKTELLQDAGQDAMKRAMDNFKSASRGAEFAAFYFAGHGASWARETYLVPMDADLGNPSTVQNLVSVSSVRAALQEANHRLLVFDNCRNNPADGWRQLEAERQANVSRETQRDDAGQASNTLVLFSTAPGRTAVDGPAGENSPFAATLLHQLDGASVDLQALPAKLRRDLLIATRGRQVVWDQSTYSQPFLLNGSRGRQPGAATDKSGWSQDPSRFIELTNAYAFAQSNGLLLPPGLIAHRPPDNSRDSHKVGTFSFLAQTMGTPSPRILVVLSVEEQHTAQVIQAGNGRTGAVWRFVTATLSGDKLDYVAREGGEHFTMTWTDANAGRVIQNPEGADSRRQNIFSTGFKRLDG
jgi:hypothetical protein